MKTTALLALAILTWLCLALLWLGLGYQHTYSINSSWMIGEYVEELRAEGAFDLPDQSSPEREDAEWELGLSLNDRITEPYQKSALMFGMALALPTVTSIACPIMLLRRRAGTPPVPN